MTTPPLIEHTVEVVASIEKVTGLPEPPPVAVGAYPGPPTTASVGAVEVTWMVWLALATWNCWVACCAASKYVLPAWSAVTTQVPTPTNDTVEPEIVHTVGVVVPKTIGLPDAPPVAVGE